MEHDESGVQGGSVTKEQVHARRLILTPTFSSFFVLHTQTPLQIKQRETAQLEKEKNKIASNDNSNNNQQRRA